MKANIILAENVVLLPANGGRTEKKFGDVQVLRLRVRGPVKHISNDDAKAEGITEMQVAAMAYQSELAGISQDGLVPHEPRQLFAMLWNGIYKVPGMRWEDNPLVWPIEFRVVR
jgi:hypothetical protein